MQKKLVVFTGAGISAESGIPTFRDANGMWGKYDAMKLASVEGLPCRVSRTYRVFDASY
ncbi:MAG: hypothetical protein IKD78_11735 [Bacteroidales bacterium]|nr:hypothetical protein [Bacteroidales bacterium]